MSVVSARDESRQQAKIKGVYAKDSPSDIFSQWRKGINPMASKTSTPNREVLATVRNNIRTRQQANTTSYLLRTPDKKPHNEELARSEQTLPEKRQAPTQTTLVASKRVKLFNERGGAQAALIARGNRIEEEKWRAKWIKVFPSLVFYFEIGVEEGTGKSLKNLVLKMGAKVEQFFSTRVTHIIIKGVNTPQKQLKYPSQTRREAHKNPLVDSNGSADLISKAEELKMKTWNVKKLSDILSRIVPTETPTVYNDSLSTLLDDERIHGTRERDVTAPRPDYYYFKPGNKYLLIEDATGKHRTIMVKEYSVTSKDGPEWPALYDSFLRISSANQSSIAANKLRERAWQLYVERKPFGNENPPRYLKRTMSLRSLPLTPRLPELPEASPYQDASGNSVIITSNIASTSTPNTPIFANTFPTLGSNKDRAIIQMSKRVQVLKGNARLAAVNRSTRELQPQPASSSSGTSASNSIPERRHSISQIEPPTKTFLSQEQVIKMLRQSREPLIESHIAPHVRARNREKVELGLKGREQDTAAGYCENCRLKYNDLSVHIMSRKHRRFAQNDENFDSLDRLLMTLERPLHPSLIDTNSSPFYGEHPHDDSCWDCCDS
ncbi:uncharacterized protein L203_105770 [Cryptococcus depauperatus CBS 7841]|uniref:Uncharacterized protein n=1 Tax=Cryptococcus depauperatus CBS 7841 TaxID=1295531 RepID=A0A1E3I9C7_9TREE|nr:regulatory subunit for Cdc7 protein kinase [Cryptococcus depauperatus CBS 7841]